MRPNIVFKSVLEGIKNIDERNKYFDSLSDEGKRLETAWDALKLVKIGNISASIGCYWDISLDDIADNCVDSKDLQKKFNIDNNIKGCSVCARGAIMLSLIRLGNSIDPSDDCRNDGNDDNLKGFTTLEMEKMEFEFEHSRYGHPYRFNSDEKLMNILCNVLVNGSFNILDRTDYLI